MEIKLSFLGASQNVTGSRFLIQTNGSNILIDCGLYQERHLRERNWDDFPLPPRQIDTVLLTHAHLDHCGWLPRLVQQGFNGKVFCTQATAEIARIVLADSASLQVEDAAYKLKRHKREGRKGPFPIQPLYTVEDAQACSELFAPVRYEQTIEVAPGIEADFHDAGHILGASMIKLKLQHNGQKRTLLFSGDIGRWDKPILRDPTLFEQADYVFVESTYGDRVHDKQEDTADMLTDAINSTIEAGGNIIVPSFAVERSQEFLYYLNELLVERRIPQLSVFLDSPMAISVTEVFQNHPELFDREMTQYLRQNESPFDFPGLTKAKSTNQSKAINQIKGTILVIAGSGMCTGGRVKHHLLNNISRPESTVLFIGYQATGTLGREIVNGAKEVRIFGQKRPVRANITKIHGFSGHADRDELFRWLKAIKEPPRQIFVVHGEADSAQQFAEYIKQNLKWNTTVPAYKDQITIN